MLIRKINICIIFITSISFFYYCPTFESSAIHITISLLANRTGCVLDLTNGTKIDLVRDLPIENKQTNIIRFRPNSPRWSGLLSVVVDEVGAIHGGLGHLMMDQSQMVPVNFDPSRSAFSVSHGALRRLHAHLGARRLSYRKYKCYKHNRYAFRIGVMIEKSTYEIMGGTQSACEESVRKLFAEASEPFKHNFGIILSVKEIVFPFAESPAWLRYQSCESTNRTEIHKNFMSHVKNSQYVDTQAAWALLTTCAPGGDGFGGLASICTKSHVANNQDWIPAVIIGISANHDSVWKAPIDTVSHEFGHLFGAWHTFEPRPWRKDKFNQFEKKGVMDYVKRNTDRRVWADQKTNEVQFHSMHEPSMCAAIEHALGGELNTDIYNEKDKTDFRNSVLSNSVCFEDIAPPQTTTIKAVRRRKKPTRIDLNFWLPIGGLILAYLCFMIFVVVLCVRSNESSRETDTQELRVSTPIVKDSKVTGPYRKPKNRQIRQQPAKRRK